MINTTQATQANTSKNTGKANYKYMILFINTGNTGKFCFLLFFNLNTFFLKNYTQAII